MSGKTEKQTYDCLKCPGYCCSYPVISVTLRDAARIARHFNMSLAQAEKRFFRAAHGHARIMKRKTDEHFGRICQFFDTETRRCTIYEARPGTCRTYPGLKSCGYYDFLAFERASQNDADYISNTWHIMR